jgi:hypothetical protein
VLVSEAQRDRQLKPKPVDDKVMIRSIGMRDILSFAWVPKRSAFLSGQNAPDIKILSIHKRIAFRPVLVAELQNKLASIFLVDKKIRRLLFLTNIGDFKILSLQPLSPRSIYVPDIQHSDALRSIHTVHIPLFESLDKRRSLTGSKVVEFPELERIMPKDNPSFPPFQACRIIEAQSSAGGSFIYGI